MPGKYRQCFIRLCICFIVYSYSSFTVAANEPESAYTRPFLWKVTGQGLTADVYLFGTAHYSDNSLKKLPDIVLSAVTASERYYSESDLSGRSFDELQELTLRTSRKSLSTSIGHENAKLIDVIFIKNKSRLQFKSFEEKKTWVLWYNLSRLGVSVEGELSLDEYLVEVAKKQNISVIALESAKEQSDSMNSLSEDIQATLVIAEIKKNQMSVDDPEADSKVKLLHAYLQGDATKIMKLVKIPTVKTHSEFINAFYIKRNKKFAMKIERDLQRYRDKNQFYAIGLAHFLGYRSIIELLRKKGYIITRV